jgi:TorA maturation chaperone TorD
MKGRHGTARHSDSHESVPMETIGIDEASVAMILSRLLGDPTPLDEDEAQQALELLSELDPEGFGKYRGVVEEFRRDWNAAMELLAGNAVPLPMEESLYKAWTTDAEHPLQGTEGFAWGDPAHHMLDVLKSFGLELDPEDERAPDHIAVLLEFLAYLLENRPSAEARSFCKDHLDWLPDLEKRLEKEAVAPVLTPPIRAARRLISTLVSSK